MNYKKFSEYATQRDLSETVPAPNMQAQQTMASNPVNKAMVRNNLMAAQKTPPPSGVNPQDYQNKLKAAVNVAKTAPVVNAAAAMDVANAQSKAMQ